jgi:hypothetical protein
MNRRVACLSALMLLGALPLGAQEVEYAAGTTRYRVSTTRKGTQSTPMGNTSFELGMRQQLTLNLARQSKDTMLATVTLDSIALDGAADAAEINALRGAKFVSLVSPTGRVYSTQSPENQNPLASQIVEGMTRFLPAYRAHLKTGETWADTTAGRVTQQGVELDRTIVSNFRVEQDTTIGGVKAYKVARTTSVRAAGSGSAQGTRISMESSGTSNGAFFVSTAGVFLGGSSSDDVDLKLKILAQGAEISMKQNAQTKIEPIQ